MAAVTVDRKRSYVQGNKRVVSAQVDIAATGDTWVTGLKFIESANANDSTNAAVGLTKSGGTLTFVTAGAITNVLVRAEGS